MHSERIKQVLRGKGVEKEAALMTIQPTCEDEKSCLKNRNKEEPAQGLGNSRPGSTHLGTVLLPERSRNRKG